MGDTIKTLKTDDFIVQENGLVRVAGTGAFLFHLRDAAASESILQQVASISHNGALIGLSDPLAALAEIRRLTVSYWSKEECSKLQGRKGT